MEYKYGGMPVEHIYTLNITQDSITAQRSMDNATSAAAVVILKSADNLNINSKQLCFVGWRLIVAHTASSSCSSSSAATCFQEHVCLVCTKTEKNIIHCFDLLKNLSSSCTIETEEQIVGISSCENKLFFNTGRLLYH